MSVSGIKLLCETRLGFDSDNQPAWLTDYRCTTPVTVPGGGLHYGAGIVTPLDSLTETPFNAAVAAAVAAHANLETSDVEAFTADDVFGGRI